MSCIITKNDLAILLYGSSDLCSTVAGVTESSPVAGLQAPVRPSVNGLSLESHDSALKHGASSVGGKISQDIRPVAECESGPSSSEGLRAVIDDFQKELAEVRAQLCGDSTTRGGKVVNFPPSGGGGRVGRASFGSSGGRGRGFHSLVRKVGSQAPPGEGSLPVHGGSSVSGDVGAGLGHSGLAGSLGPGSISKDQPTQSVGQPGSSDPGVLVGSSGPNGLSYAGAVRLSSKPALAPTSGNPCGPQSLTFMEPVVDNGRVKMLPPKEVSEEGKTEWENKYVGGPFCWSKAVLCGS